jgi:putative flippase GtrA
MKRIYESNGLSAQLFRYGIAGSIAAIVDVGSFFFFITYLSIYYPIAIVFSFSLGTFVNFLICNSYIFDRGNLPFGRAFLRHYFSGLGGLLTNELLMFSLIDIVHFPGMLAAKIIATICAFFVNFTLIRFYAFNSQISLRRKIRGRK